MKWTSVLAIYFLFFGVSAFLLLPFGVRTDEEVGRRTGRRARPTARRTSSTCRGICFGQRWSRRC